MSMSVGASTSSALSYLQSLLQQGSTQDTKKTSSSDPLSMLMQAMSGDTTAAAQTQSTATATQSTGTSCPQFNSETMSALLSAQGQQSADSPSSKLFAKLDTDGDGQVSKTEFSDAASTAGADSATVDAVFAKIDGDGDGAISQSELTEADMSSHRIGAGPPPSGGGGSGASSGTDGATTSSTTNADGSTTTTISYADGSEVTMTTAATAESGDTSSGSSTDSSTKKSASNLLEQLIKLQSQMLSAATSTLSAVA